MQTKIVLDKLFIKRDHMTYLLLVQYVTYDLFFDKFTDLPRLIGFFKLFFVNYYSLECVKLPL